ncbi:MAG TPA: serine/threonine-protein kinase [Myxococcales bacterium]|nr:serine/threonine-protein kinase [Myxococcales bacterium]
MRGWFGPFRLERQVGRGGLGAVFRAVDSRTGATVALKMLPPGTDPIGLTRLRREFAALRMLSHPNIVRVLDVGEEDGIPWLSMEFVEGLSLREWLSVVGDPVLLEPEPVEGASEGVDLDVLFDEPDSGIFLATVRARRLTLTTGVEAMLSPEEQAEQNRQERLAALCESMAQLCDGLSFIHARGLVHRDLKPSNILVTPAHRAILVDFGLVKRLHEDRATDPGRAVGTYRYMAPEQARGETVDLRADLYSLGATLYELLAARPPFTEQNQLALLEAVIGRRPTPVSEINPGAPRLLGALCDRLLAKRPEDRPRDAAEVASTLRSIGSTLTQPN